MSAAPVTYLLPIKARTPPADELTAYLQMLSARAEIVVVDGSPPAVFAEAHARWSRFARHLPPREDLTFLNGKVNGVITGLAEASHEVSEYITYTVIQPGAQSTQWLAVSTWRGPTSTPVPMP